MWGRDRVGGIAEPPMSGFPPPLTPPHKGEGNPHGVCDTVDRSTAPVCCRSRSTGRATRVIRRHAGLGAAGERRASRRPLVQVPSPARHPLGWLRGAQRAGGARAGARREPNTRATTAELFDGLAASSQNRWPSLAFDLLAINSVIAPFLAAGFYYKTFMWPASFWEKVYEPLIRRAAGSAAPPRRRTRTTTRE